MTMTPRQRMYRSGQRWSRARWRHLVAVFTLLALAWPSLGPMPWMVERHATHAGTAHHDDFDASPAHLHSTGPAQVDPTDAPGSPFHPADHDCFACQVLSHLARCMPAAPAVFALPPASMCPVRTFVVAEVYFAVPIAVLPPARAPPPPSA